MNSLKTLLKLNQVIYMKGEMILCALSEKDLMPNND
jgi:hypothetical protein